MSNKTPHRRLQRLVEEEWGVRPKLQFCFRLLEQNPRPAGRSIEEWISAVAVSNEAALRAKR